MTPEQQRIKIAEACGLTLTDAWGHTTNGKTWEPLPNYLSDLNACHEMEKTLDNKANIMDEEDGFCTERDRYMDTLQSITDARPTHQDDCEWAFLTATPAQRCQAFLRTLGLWEGE